MKETAIYHRMRSYSTGDDDDDEEEEEEEEEGILYDR
jgi:hypothetical protein